MTWYRDCDKVRQDGGVEVAIIPDPVDLNLVIIEYNTLEQERDELRALLFYLRNIKNHNHVHHLSHDVPKPCDLCKALGYYENEIRS